MTSATYERWKHYDQRLPIYMLTPDMHDYKEDQLAAMLTDVEAAISEASTPLDTLAYKALRDELKGAQRNIKPETTEAARWKGYSTFYAREYLRVEKKAASDIETVKAVELEVLSAAGGITIEIHSKMQRCAYFALLGSVRALRYVIDPTYEYAY